MSAAPAVDLEDPDLVDTFTDGACHLLARVLHKLTGWPLLVVTDGRSWTHMGVRHPDGDFLDVEGLAPDDQVLSSYGWSPKRGEYGWGIAVVETTCDYEALTEGPRFRALTTGPEARVFEVAGALLAAHPA